MTVGARRRLVVRRRHRVVGSIAVGAAAAAAITLFVTSSTPGPQPVASSEQKTEETVVHLDAAELTMLVDTSRFHATADWHQITKPLRPYRNLVKGIK